MRLVAVSAVALAASGGALAYYSSSGDGSGSASVAAPDALTIAARTPSTSLLYPGGSGEVDATISNPNGFAVRVNSLVLGAGGISPDASHPGCDTSALDYVTQTNGGAGWLVPARVGSSNGSLDVRLPDAITMDVAAANACQGATFSVALATGP
ncbi:MAG TPA: hypothetical protein VFA66_05285 [Gaiellaceae bacterium]|nr:hypothetical protein [Gaiellaceae bacterium]